MSDSFKTVSDGHYSRQRGLPGTSVLLGLECPKCKHVFMPVPFMAETVTCENCGFSETLKAEAGLPPETKGETK